MAVHENQLDAFIIGNQRSLILDALQVCFVLCEGLFGDSLGPIRLQFRHNVLTVVHLEESLGPCAFVDNACLELAIRLGNRGLHHEHEVEVVLGET